MNERAQEIIDRLDLTPHPEGGFYRETFRSQIIVETHEGSRSASTAILYLLVGTDVSRFHRIDADEVWHFHEGDPLTLYTLRADAKAESECLHPGNPQLVVKRGDWFGAALDDVDSYCLISCTVAPGFEFSGFELAETSTLLSEWPDAENWIRKLT